MDRNISRHPRRSLLPSRLVRQSFYSCNNRYHLSKFTSKSKENDGETDLTWQSSRSIGLFYIKVAFSSLFVSAWEANIDGHTDLRMRSISDIKLKISFTSEGRVCEENDWSQFNLEKSTIHKNSGMDSETPLERITNNWGRRVLRRCDYLVRI